MMGRTHRIVGALAGAGTAQYMGLPAIESAACVTAAVVGGLLPDLDHAHASLSRRLPLWTGRILPMLLSHRGFTHSLIPLAALFLFWKQAADPLQAALYLGLLAGVASHVAADMLTGGVRLLWPIRLRIGLPFKTGGAFEKLALAGSLALFVLVVASFQS